MNYFDGVTFARADMLTDTEVELTFRARFYSIEYIHSGAMCLTMDGREFRHEAPCLFHTWPGLMLHYDTRGGTLRRTHYWICFSGPRVERFLAGGLLNLHPESPLRTVKNPNAFLHQMQTLITLIRTGAQMEKSIMLLEQLLFEISEQDSPANQLNSFYADALKKLLARILLDPRKSWNFTEEARKLGITLNHFNRIFRKLARTSPRQFVIHSRLQKAVELLFDPACEVKEIAARAGIENEFYFSRLFKKKYGMSPSAYRSTYCIGKSRP